MKLELCDPPSSPARTVFEVLARTPLTAIRTDAQVWVNSSSFLTPSTLALGDASLGPAALEATEPLKALPPMFNAEGLEATQGEAASTDGTKVQPRASAVDPRVDTPQQPFNTLPCSAYLYGGERADNNRKLTQVPYFIIKKKDSPLDGTTPTLLYGYGGFEIPLTPGYQGVTGAAWLERGGCFVMANIR